MAPLSIHAIASWLPAARPQRSLLGSAVPAAYHHLFDPAGVASRPPTVRRGATTLACAGYEAPVADAQMNVAQMASGAVDRLFAGRAALKPRVAVLLHAQCTLNQRILGSSCLRIAHEQLPQARLARSIGQLGTAGLPTLFRLAALQLAAEAPDTLLCLSAADKWIAPFFRRVPGVLTLADAAAACLVGGVGTPAIAVVDDIVTSMRPYPADLWAADAAALREHLLAHASEVVAQLGAAAPGAMPLLAGDGYDAGFQHALAQQTGLALLEEPAAATTHAGSAAALLAIERGVAVAVQRQQALDLLVWTVSIAGWAGALRVRCLPDAVPRPA